MIRKVIIRTTATVVCIAAILIMYFIFKAPATVVVTDTPVPLPITTVKKQDVITSRSFPVTIEGEMDVEIRPQIEGYLLATLVKEGDFVKRGTVLFRIDDALYREQLHVAAANLSASEASLEKAAIELERNKELLHNRIISEIQYRTIQADYKEAKAIMLQNKAARESARIRMEYTCLKAPVDGLVGRLPYRKGSFISTANVDPLTMLSAVDHVRACFSIGERDYLPFIEAYKKSPIKVSLQLADGSVFPHEGTISAVNGSFDKNTGAMPVWIDFPNLEHILRSGNTGSVRIEKPLKNVLLIPQKATFRQQDKTLVYLLDAEDRVKSHVIRTTDETEGQMVVEEGLQTGDRILLSGMNKVMEGMKIQPISK